jgi:hypothetical protein
MSERGWSVNIATMSAEQLAENLADYMATRHGGWPDEVAMREAVRETVRLIFTEARPDTFKVLGVDKLRARLAEALDRRDNVAGWSKALARNWDIRVQERRDALAILESEESR